ncbi:MAG: BrnA antitoxin family protein [Deltaproteobacteria bacterium]|nr:BrnA antitoxin family protein [Deltaproteobacteria bacterium]
MRTEIAKLKRGRAPGSGNKESTTVRFDKDILAAFKATGKGWQTRINDALRDWLKEHKPV